MSFSRIQGVFATPHAPLTEPSTELWHPRGREGKSGAYPPREPALVCLCVEQALLPFRYLKAVDDSDAFVAEAAS